MRASQMGARSMSLCDPLAVPGAAIHAFPPKQSPGPSYVMTRRCACPPWSCSGASARRREPLPERSR
jgi:hypothetical protein